MTYLLFCTPKAAYKIQKEGLPEAVQDWDIEIVPTSQIYMNMADGWTEEKCDDTIYLVDKESFSVNIATQPSFKRDNK